MNWVTRVVDHSSIHIRIPIKKDDSSICHETYCITIRTNEPQDLKLIFV